MTEDNLAPVAAKIRDGKGIKECGDRLRECCSDCK